MYKISNWNIERPKNNTQKTKLVLAKIHETNSDIIVLTETTDAVDLSENYKYTLKTRSFERTPTEQWVAIWSKWKITEQIPTFNENRTTCGRISSPFGEIIIYGTIIPYHMAGVSGERYGNLNYKLWQYHEEDIFKQSEDWRRIIQQNQNIPFLIIGDFNQSRTNNNGYETKRVREILTEQLNKNNLSCLTEIDFSGKYLTPDKKNGKIRNNIDHICASANWIKRIKRYEAGAWNHFNDDGFYLSDHNGVYIRFEL